MNQTEIKKTRYRVQALERALDILDCFSFQKREMGLSEIVQQTGLNKTTVKRLSSNLTDRGYLEQDPDSKSYRLGMRLFELGGVIFSSFSLRKAATHPMNRLQNKTGATVLLGVMMDDHLVYVDKREGDGMLRIASDIGWRRPLHFGMLGMVLMAHLEREKVRDIFKRYPLEAHTPFSITDNDAFSIRLEEIRKQGYVIERDEAVEGSLGIAAPIRDYSRQVVAALGMAVPVGQSRERKDIDNLIKILTRTSDEISSNLGYLKV
ncbi:IclR family transcriptional regulator [Thermodesulfobacteriota bacterium]